MATVTQRSTNQSNPRYAIRRRARFAGTYTVKFYSYTREGKEIEHTTTVNPETGKVWCTCEDFQYRARKAARPCKHILRAAAAIERKARRDSRYMDSLECAA